MLSWILQPKTFAEMKISRSTLAYPPGRPEASLKTIAITCSTGAVSILNNPWFGLSIDVSLHSAAGSNICILCVLSRGGELCSFWLPCEDEDERRRRQQELAGDEELSSLPGVVTTNHQDRGNKFLWEECRPCFISFYQFSLASASLDPKLREKTLPWWKFGWGINLSGTCSATCCTASLDFPRPSDVFGASEFEWLAGSCLIDLQLFLFMSQSRLSRVSKYSKLTNIECARKWTCIFHIQVSKFFGNNRMLGETTWVTSQDQILEELTFFGPWKHNSFCMSGRNNTRYRRDILPKHKSLNALLKPFVPWTDLTSWANAEKKGPEGLDVREEESVKSVEIPLSIFLVSRFSCGALTPWNLTPGFAAEEDRRLPGTSALLQWCYVRCWYKDLVHQPMVQLDRQDDRSQRI